MTTKVSPYKTIISGNGAVVSSSQGRRLGEYDRWGMSWNGNLFAPPDSSSCVLYFPGYPGAEKFGVDFSSNFLDSAIDTDEELTAVETDVDCDADATTAIPVGSVIRVEDELMYVSATGTTLTVIRGYAGSHAATHATNADIYRRTANNGGATNALRRRLPSGLWYLDFDGTDDLLQVTNHSSIQITVWTVEYWFNTDAVVANYFPIEKSGNWSTELNTNAYRVYVRGTGGGYIGRYQNVGTIVAGTWYHCMVTYDGGTLAAGIKCYLNAIQIDDTTDNGGTFTAPVNNTATWRIGGEGGYWYNGKIAIPRFYNAVLASTVGLTHYNRERHLFGV